MKTTIFIAISMPSAIKFAVSEIRANSSVVVRPRLGIVADNFFEKFCSLSRVFGEQNDALKDHAGHHFPIYPHRNFDPGCALGSLIRRAPDGDTFLSGTRPISQGEVGRAAEKLKKPPGVSECCAKASATG